MALTGIDHVVIRVNDLQKAIGQYKELGLELSNETENKAVGKIGIFRLADGFFLELVEPLTPESPIGRALESRGEGVHTIALAVDDVETSIEDLEGRGAQIIRGDGLPLAFIHPKATPGAMLQIMEPTQA